MRSLVTRDTQLSLVTLNKRITLREHQFSFVVPPLPAGCSASGNASEIAPRGTDAVEVSSQANDLEGYSTLCKISIHRAKLASGRELVSSSVSSATPACLSISGRGLHEVSARSSTLRAVGNTDGVVDVPDVLFCSPMEWHSTFASANVVCLAPAPEGDSTDPTSRTIDSRVP